jgi:hypothetical protein
MKPPVVPALVLELLDREEVWRWRLGTAKGIDQQILNYLTVATKLGRRPTSKEGADSSTNQAGVFAQRMRNLHRHGTIDVTLYDRLSTLPYWVWETGRITPAAQEIFKLETFWHQHKRRPTPGDGSIYIAYTKILYRRNKKVLLSPEELEQCNSMPIFDFVPRKLRWLGSYRRVQAVFKKLGRPPIGRTDSDINPAIYRFLSKTRYLNRHGKLSPAQISMMEQLPGFTW